MTIPSARWLSLALLVTALGCSGGDGPSKQASGGASAGGLSEPASAASEFMTAVIAGDNERATECLTPKAIERFRSEGKRFMPPGLETAKFRLGEVRMRSDTEAAVQCMLTDSAAPELGEKELVCLMRRVDNQWRVAKLACEADANAAPVMVDFENLPPGPAPDERPQPRTGPRYVESPAPEIPPLSENATPETKPTRTASELPAGPVR